MGFGRRTGGHDLQDCSGLRTEGSLDKADVPVLSGINRAGAQEAFRPGAARSRKAMPDNSEIFAPEQYDGPDTRTK
jgi:hypothetical protein